MATAEPPTGSSVSYRRQYRRCGRPRCPTCGAPGAPGHGPYWYAYWWQEGRMRSHYVGKHLPDGVAHELPTAASPAEEAPRPAGLRVRSLGAFMVWRGEDAIPAGGWGRRKVALLFKCLLSAPGYRLHREELLERLWPEADPATAARNLSSTLHRLRGLLDTGSVSSSHVRLEGDVLTLHPSPGGPVGEDWLDAVAFARAAGVALAGSDPGACRAALARYGGDYLPEEPYEDWMSARRDELRAQYLALLERLAVLSLAGGERQEAERCLRAVLAREPTHEPAARRLMRLLGETGRRAEALRVYQTLTTRLREELALAPEARTAALHAALLARDQAAPAGNPALSAADPPLPGGTLTFLLTEIEGSVVLREQYPATMPMVLHRHQALLAASLAEQAGRLVKGQGEGDSTFVVFTTPTAALAAACAIQRALMAELWPEGLTVRVRMALHTGEAHSHDGAYVGAAVNRSARLRSMAHGGQILVSQAAAELVRDTLPEGVGLRPLGVFQLRGLERAEPVYQVLHPRLPADFPPPPAPEARRGNLPAPLTGLIGREAAVEEVRRLVASTRLLTLTGSGGIGKTRLALEVAGEMVGACSDGVWLVELASLSEPHLMPQAVARALGVREDSGNVPGRSVLATLADSLRDRALLLVLDNCEHVLDACAEAVGALLAAAPQLRIMATSREALAVAGEIVWRVPPLGLPGESHLPEAELSSYAAVQLFVARAQAVRPGFRLTAANHALVAQICRRLDGLPLAIELAAARLGGLGLEGMAARLDDRFKLLTTGTRTAPARQQTLRATMDWSWDLLSEAECLLLRRLAVFAGGWTLEAAEAVCAGEGLESAAVLDLLARLVAKSLVQVGEQDEGVRYGLLETVRQYALEQLTAAGEDTELRDRHLTWCLELAERAEPELTGPGQAAWLPRLETEYDNLRAALRWALDGGDALVGMRAATALYRYWERRGHLSDGLGSLEALLRRVEEAGNATAVERAMALFAAGMLADRQDDYGRAEALFERSLALAQEAGDGRGIAQALRDAR